MTCERGAFELDGAPLLSRSTVDRSEGLRDTATLGEQWWTSGRVVLVDALGRTPLTEGERLASRPAIEFGAEPTDAAVLLGIDNGVGYWAVPAEETAELAKPAGNSGASGDSGYWRDLRAAGALLSDTDAGLLTTAVGLLSWHERAGYCAVCGAATERVRAGWERRCTGCGREEYPRTDPAVICLVHDDADHVLLARQVNWPAERFSVLAGFVEVGESLEACVRREVAEEVGVGVRDVRYLGSQPWPFPRSLMLGFAAVAEPGAPLRPDDSEIAEARWIPREHVQAALDARGEAVGGLRMPPGVSIAHRMLRGWAFQATGR